MAQNMACHKSLLVKTLPCHHPSLLVSFLKQTKNYTIKILQKKTLFNSCLEVEHGGSSFMENKSLIN